MLALGACSDGPKEKETPREDIPLSRSEAEVVGGINGLSASLMSRLGGNVESNFVVSPLSLAMNLGMVANGTAGETQQQIIDAINMGPDDIDALNGLMHKLMDKLPALDPKTEVSIANSLWLESSKSASFNPAFTTKLNTDYYAYLKTIDDLGGAGGAKQINAWANDRTKGLIPQIIKEELGNVSFAAINALYFKGFWRQQFNKKRTSERLFTNLDGSTFYRKTMEHDAMLVQAYDEEHYRAIAIPYGNEAYSMIILLPDEGLDPVKTFAEANIDDLTKLAKGEMYSSRMHVRLPRFDITTNVNFVPALKAMGMTLPFNPNADFSPMTTSEICLGKVFQGAKIIVDEEGTEAAAVTVSSGLDACGPPNNPEFFVDHSFAFAIAERSTGVMLFIGAVTHL